MSGASIEETLDLWSAELREVKAQIQPLCGHASVAASASAFLDGLRGPERRKTGWRRAEAAGDPGPWRQQAVLGRSRWEADALRDLMREYVVETPAAPDAVLVLDETGFLKQGKASCGVGRQYTGSAGEITNCQIGVFAAHVSAKGYAFIDRRLYLPKDWTDAPARLAAAHVPAAVGFATKPRLAVGMIERAIRAGVPFAWAAADSIYGVGEVEGVLRRAGKGYGLGVTGTHPFRSWGKRSPAGAARRRRSRPGCRPGPTFVSRRGKAPRGRGSTTGLTWSWQTWRRKTWAAPAVPTCGRGVCSSGAAWPTRAWRSSPPGARRARRLGCWSGSRAAAGRSRTASRPPRPNSGLITTRRAAGMAGTATCRWSCSPSPCWR